MKRPSGLIFLLLSAVLLSMQLLPESAITGRVVPADAMESVWVINSNNDSLKATASDGAFSISVKEGIYKVVVDAREPYKDAIIESVEVQNGQNTDLGEIRLEQ